MLCRLLRVRADVKFLPLKVPAHIAPLARSPRAVGHLIEDLVAT